MVKVKAKTSRKGIRNPTACKEPSQCPHEHFRYEVPDRRDIARDKHTNILATPKGYRWEDGKKDSDDEEKPARKTPIRKRSCPDKYAKKPEKAYVHNFLAEVWSFLTPEMAERLKNMLMNEFSMSDRDAEEFIFKQREANIVNSSTVSLYKKPRDIGDGKVVFDSVIKMRTPNKTYCDKFPKSNIGIRNSWIKDFSDLISDKMADYVLETMTAERTERQQEIAQNLLNRFNTLLEQKASLANPKTQTHKTMVLVADRLSLWLDKNVPMAKETAQRLKDIQEAQEQKKAEDERRKKMKEQQKKPSERAGEGIPEDKGQEEDGDQGPGTPIRGPPGGPQAEIGEPGVKPGEPGVEPGDAAQPDEPGAQPGEPRVEPGKPQAEPGEPGVDPGDTQAQPGEPGPQPGEAEPDATQPGEAEATAREGAVQPGKSETAPGATDEDNGTKPATGEDKPPIGEETKPDNVNKLASPEKQPIKGEEDVTKDSKTDDVQPTRVDETQPGKADETQPGEANEELKRKEDQDQTPAFPTTEEKQAISDQTAGTGKEEATADVPPSSETQPGKADTEGMQPGVPAEGKSLEELDGDKDKVVGPTTTQPGITSEQPTLPPSDDEVQPTPSEIQRKAVEEALGEEKADDKPKSTTLPVDSGQKIPGEEPTAESPNETPEAAPEQVAASVDRAAPTEPGARPVEVEKKIPGVDEEQFYEPSDEGKAPTDQKAGEPSVLPGEQPTSKTGEKPTDKPIEPVKLPATTKELTPEQQRQLEVIQSVTSKILEMPIEDSPRQEAIKDVLEKQLEKELGDDNKPEIDQVASKVGTWIDKMVEQVENEYGDRGRRTPSTHVSKADRRSPAPLSQKPKGSIFVVKKVDDRQGYDVDVISNTLALEKIRLARGKSPARVEVPNPESALEPADLKNWAKWATAVSEMAQSWAKWIEDTVQEAQKRGEILQTDDSPERLREWDEFRGKKAQGAQQWRKTKEEMDHTAKLWSRKGMKTREARQPQT